MHQPRFRYLVLLLLIFLLGCNRNPLGMSDEEWLRLTPQEQSQARQKQIEYDLRQQQIESENRIRMAEAEARRQEAQHAQDIENGLIAELSPKQPICIGGSRCGGSESQIIIPLHALMNIDVIQFRADDAIGNKQDGVALLYADDQLIQRIDIKKRTQWHEVFVGKTARNIVIRPETDDEIRFYTIKLFGQAINSGSVQYHIIRK